MNWWIERERLWGGARARGLGITMESGILGTTIGEPGRNMFWSITVWIWWGWTLHMTWKRLWRHYD